jgi:hypothetical protein
MRSIENIIQELKNHPDYVYDELWTKRDVAIYFLDELNERDYDYSSLTSDDIIELMDESDWSGSRELLNQLEFEYGSNILERYFPELDKRILRNVKINNVIKNN